MAISLYSSWLAVFSCLLFMGTEVRCDCSLRGVEMRGGYYNLTQQLEPGSMMIYRCPENYYPYPHITRLCQFNRKWQPAPRSSQQRCRLIECPDPNVLELGTVFPLEDRYFVGNETTYKCYSGYTMRGSSRRVCLKNGKWSGSTPICSRQTEASCADPGIPPGALRQGNSFEIGDTVTYSCMSNMFLVGSPMRVCQENRQWSSREPACYYAHTYDTPLEVSEAFGSSIKETLTTLEATDDTQEGRKIRITEKGTLNIYIGLDISQSINKKDFNDARKAIATLITKISSFSVTPNYEIVFFSSRVYEVVNILDFFDGAVMLNSVLKDINAFKIGEKNSGTDLSLVLGTFLERMSIIKIRVGEEAFREHQHVLILFSDGAYNTGGSPTPNLERIKNLIYMNQTYEKNLDIYVFGIGAKIFDADLLSLTVGTDGQHYFRMDTIENLHDTFDEIIDEEAVRGLCGVHRKHDSKTKSTRKNYPWYAFISVLKETERKCLGSLVTPKFVLTAAHCFKFDDLPEQVTVEIDDEQGKIKRVEKLYLHPKYNITAKVDKNVSEFYDYDVALIQLKDAVKLSTAVKPICIPCTQETSDALKLVGQSTCRQQEEELLKGEHVSLNFLTKINDGDVKSKGVLAKRGSYRSDCIRHALSAPGINTKNVSAVVTDNFLCTGGRSPYRDYIACKGDSGGAVFRDHSLRTIQIGVVSWGTEVKCTSGGMVESGETSRDFHINLFKVLPFLKRILGNDNQDEYAPLLFLEH